MSVVVNKIGQFSISNNSINQTMHHINADTKGNNSSNLRCCINVQYIGNLGISLCNFTSDSKRPKITMPQIQRIR